VSEPTGGRADIERSVIERSLQDDAFRRRLLEDPRATMEQELGVQLPADMRVQAVEETADTIYLVLPSVSSSGVGDEMSDLELETVAGGAPGGTASGDTCNTAACWGLTCLDGSDCG